jgi:hypothetical protein
MGRVNTSGGMTCGQPFRQIARNAPIVAYAIRLLPKHARPFDGPAWEKWWLPIHPTTSPC